ncbi:MAG: TonB-dependent receptor [Acidobacteria bacterium]|nr:TonB-dependent receptor [Acidobacteriota bacterium]NIM61170.1 TonB-dependent receptor [Acidobacteriota bacterium]NIO58733.1 TonB-dependent receptor [Acidobacteriota bacterium]NIQ31494.1 TonB-dependent receptor [Acidobacteriota bacterium]NIQ84507.1 TonB-dependent receptor [Acidobacteriota bacterium]
MSEKRWWAVTAGLLLLLGVACNGSPEPTGDGTGSSTPDPSTPPPASTSVETTGATGTSSISGNVRYEGAVPTLRPLQMDADPGCAKKHTEDVMPEVLVLGDDNALGNVLVYVKSGHGGGAYAPPAEPVVLDQIGCKYTPHVTSVQTGQAFKILNSDGLLHNVHGLPKANTPFNKAMPAAVTESDYVFDKEEVFKIKCDVHPWMGAWVGVFGHPFHGVTGTDGQFSLDGLPAGTYEVEALHERLGTLTAQVTVGDGDAATHEFVFVKE